MSAPRAVRPTGDDGAAIVDFVMVGALATIVFLGIIQLGAVLHVRNTLIDCASEGARYGGLADREPADGAQRTRELVATALSARYADDVDARTTVVNGIDVVEVQVSAPLPVIGLFGPGTSITVSGHGIAEG